VILPSASSLASAASMAWAGLPRLSSTAGKCLRASSKVTPGANHQGFRGDCLPRDLTFLASASTRTPPPVVMPRSPKTWRQKMSASPPHTVTLDKSFAGVPAGARLLISSPHEIEAFLRTHTGPGDRLTIQELRRRLARVHAADAACPVSTSIFLRTVSEAAWEDIERGAAATEVAPFWRAVEPGSPLARKLRCGSEWITHQRAAEAAGTSDTPNDVETRRPPAGADMSKRA
jgi:hypothetical protein